MRFVAELIVFTVTPSAFATSGRDSPSERRLAICCSRGVSTDAGDRVR